MNSNKKTITAVGITFIASLGIGIAIGSSLKSKGGSEASEHKGVAIKDVNWNEKTPDELNVSLSEIMLPEDEFQKLGDAIYQTAMSLFMAQAQGAGLSVSDDSQQELKKTINEKYSRKYFADINANSMKDLNKDELIAILSFYNTEPGQKFLNLSPKIIQSTMTTVQGDLSAWLPKTVDALVTKLKTGGTDKPEEPKNDLPKAPEGGEADKS